MSKWIDADALKYYGNHIGDEYEDYFHETQWVYRSQIDNAPSIDIVRCQDCKKSHIDGKTTHYLWCTEWGRSTDTFGYCERGERAASGCIGGGKVKEVIVKLTSDHIKVKGGEYVQDLVRCEDCNNADFSGCPKDRLYCMEHGTYFNADDFCSYGEREGE